MTEHIAMFVGISRLIPDVSTFVVPIFSNDGENYLSQEVEDGNIIDFKKIFIGEEFQPLNYKISVEVGDAALYGFELYSDCFLVGPARLLARIIEIWKTTPDSKNMFSATEAAIDRFLNVAKIIKKNTSNNFSPVFFCQRELMSDEWSIRLMDEAAINLIESNSSDNMEFNKNIFNRTKYPTVPSTSTEVRRQRQGRLWSNLKEVCDLLHISTACSIATDELLFQHVRFKTGQRVLTIGQPFDTLYIVNSGFLKTVLIDEFGNEQVLSFPMKGDMLGVDGIHTKHYSSEAVALSDCDLILFPFKKLTGLGRIHLELENVMYGVMSRELQREQAMIGMLGALSDEARVARFLVSLADRFEQMGYSSKLFSLIMTRHEIGSYLGLTLETVNRTLSAFNEIGLISVDQRTIGIKDADALKTLRRLPPSRSRTKQRSVAKLNAPIEKKDSAKKIAALTPKKEYFSEHTKFLLEGILT